MLRGNFKSPKEEHSKNLGSRCFEDAQYLISVMIVDYVNDHLNNFLDNW